MQTTLLGFAIAIILALVAALVGPIFVDWGRYRGEFETRASRLTGLDFRVTGAIDARLLPTPTLMLQGVEFGRPNEGSKVRARALRIEFALGALVRGAWRITDARLEGPELTAGLDPSGHLSWPVPKLGFDLEAVAIERLNIEDGRAVLVDDASDSRLVLDKVEFHGELRSLAGPVKGDGSFVVAGQQYPYSVSTGRIAGDGGVKVRLAVNPVDLPLTTEADLTISIERGAPRFEGSIQVARAVGRAPAGAPSLIIDSWRVTSRVKGDSTAALLDQIELQYGPDDRAIKLKGSANLTFGRRPQVNGVLSSPQIDLDRVLGLPEATRRRPLVAIKTLVESFIAASRLPVPTTLSMNVENVTLGGAMLARVGADVKVDADGVDVRRLELRAPGVTQVRISGRLRDAATGTRFEGSTRIEANDPRGLIAWLTDRTEQAPAAGPWRLGADVTLGSDSIAIEQLKLELDRLSVDGRIAYAWASDDRPARLDAAITAPEIDLDRINTLSKALLGDAAFDWPRDVTLSLKVGRAIVAGLEAKQTDVNMRIGANGIEIDKLAIADFAGASLAVKAHIDTKAQPHGTMTLDFDARTLDGLLVLLEKSAPQAADQLRRSAGRLTPLTMRASLALDPGATGSTAATATFKIDGRAGVTRLALQGDVGTASDGGKLDIAALGAAQMNVSARLDADEGAALMDLIGLDRFIAVDKRPGRLTLTAKGRLGGDLVVDSQLAVGALGISANGSMRVSGGAGPSAGLNLKIVNANIRSPRTLPADRPAELLPTSVSASVDLTDQTLFTEVAGTVAGTNVAGRVVLRNQQPMTLDGDIELGSLDLPAAIAVAIGIPTQAGGANTSTGAGALGKALGLWPAEPFERGLLRLGGQLSVKAAQVPLTAKLAARDVKGVLRIGESQLALQVIDASMAGGRMAGELVFLRHGDGLIARSRIRLTDANAAEMFPGDGLISGRLAFDLSAEGTGMSAGALIGSLEGGGRFTLENGRLARLDPAAFEAVMRAVDRGLPVNAISVRERLESALSSGALAIARAEGPIVINAGQARLNNTIVRAQGADLTVGGSVDLAEGTLEARLLLFGPGGAGSPIDTRPEITIALKGPVNAPKRTIDAAALANWLALRAVEQQSKKLDVLEGREASPPPAPPAVDSSAKPAPN
ncbi:MAG TPA: AsmA family protein [Xanthobacteraceae bacterium]|nr:AsmA family protein [Xanthobacteraceae bacterium]